MGLLADVVFTEFKNYLKDGLVKKVFLVKELDDPDRKGRKLLGYIKNGIIYVSNDQCQHEKLKTFLHELAHAVFIYAPEKHIAKVEDFLWKKLSRKQKKYLEKWIPKKISRAPVRY